MYPISDKYGKTLQLLDEVYVAGHYKTIEKGIITAIGIRLDPTSTMANIHGRLYAPYARVTTYKKGGDQEDPKREDNFYYGPESTILLNKYQGKDKYRDLYGKIIMITSGKNSGVVGFVMEVGYSKFIYEEGSLIPQKAVLRILNYQTHTIHQVTVGATEFEEVTEKQHALYHVIIEKPQMKLIRV